MGRNGRKASSKEKAPAASGKKPSRAKPKPPPIQITASVRSPHALYQRFVQGNPATIEQYFLARQAASLAQADQFDNLICLNTLRGVQQYAYQVETVRKVMRSFRRRISTSKTAGGVCFILWTSQIQGSWRDAHLLARVDMDGFMKALQGMSVDVNIGAEQKERLVALAGGLPMADGIGRP